MKDFLLYYIKDNLDVNLNEIAHLIFKLFPQNIHLKNKDVGDSILILKLSILLFELIIGKTINK